MSSTFLKFFTFFDINLFKQNPIRNTGGSTTLPSLQMGPEQSKQGNVRVLAVGKNKVDRTFFGNTIAEKRHFGNI